MDFSSQLPESPSRPLAGAARSRVFARQQRNSAQKPYSRSEMPNSGSSGSLNAQDGSNALTATPASKPARGAFSPLRVAASPLALLGSVGKMVSKPLSWLTRSAVSSEPELGMPTSSSTGSLSSMARKRAAVQASKGTNDVEASSSTFTAGNRLAAAGLRPRTAPPRDDEESQLRPPPSSSLEQQSSPSRRNPPRTGVSKSSSKQLVSSALARSFTISDNLDAGGRTTRSNRAPPRSLKLGSSGPNESFDVQSDSGRAGSPSMMNLRSPRSQLSFQRGSSLRPDDAMSESGSVLSHSASSLAFGYGNEVRYATNTFGLPPSSSPFQLAARNGVRRARSSLGPALYADATPQQSPRANYTGLRSASPAPSIALSTSRGTPLRRNWNDLNLAGPSTPSIGDDMMKVYLSKRSVPKSSSFMAPLRSNATDDMLISSPARSAATASIIDDSDIYTPGRLGKRDLDMSVDGDSERPVGTPSKRRMVWHPEMGFISHEELKAREPKLPSPKNEAERLLNVLENMRATKTKPATGAAKAPPASVHVPTPIAEPSTTKPSSRGDASVSIQVAPYSRAARKAKESQPASDSQSGIRSRLRRNQAAVSSSNAMEEDDKSVSQTADNEEESNANSETEAEDVELEPKPEPIRRSKRLQHSAPEAPPAKATPAKASKKQQDAQLKSALKQTPLKAVETVAPVAIETPKPSSHRISLAAANKAPATTIKKDNFTVKASATQSDGPRERSSLRQGAAKTSRKHESSGKFSAWDEADEDEEDMPDATELAKIKIPTNMFPSGFTFGATDPSKSEPAKVPETQPAGGSLLDRLGGFEAAKAAPKVKGAEAATETKASEKPSFSFTIPTKDAPSAPKFSFSAPAGPASTEQKSSEASKAPLKSDFFSKPSTPLTTTFSEEKKDGPVPNFFANAMKEFDAKTPAIKATSGSSGASFSFGASTESATPQTGSFGGSSFGGSKDKTESAQPHGTKPAFFGGVSGTAPASGGFSFGPTASSGFGSKRSADDDAEPPAKKSGTSFTFGSVPSVEAPKPASSTETFSFNASTPAATTAKEDSATKPSSIPNFFGAKSDSPAPSTSGFTFGKPAEAASAPVSGDFGSPKPESATTPASASGFTFSKPAFEASKPANTGFSFGAPVNSKPATSAPSFSFGASASSDAAPTASPTTPGTGTTTPTNAFTFGTPASTAPAAAAKPASSGFSFGSSSSASTTAPSGGFGGFGNTSSAAPAEKKTGFGGNAMMDDAPQSSAPSANKFTFGAPASGTASTPSAAPAPAMSFSFGAPSAAASSPAPAATGFGSGQNSTFTFGSAAPASGPVTPSGAPSSGGFRFGSPAPTSGGAAPSTGFTFGSAGAAPASTPASPFLVSQQTPTTPGGSPFQFGAPQPAASSGAPFQFGAGSAPPPSSTFAFGAPASSAPAPTFGGFNAGTPPPSAGGQGTPGSGFTFGGGMPSMPSMPSMPGTPGAGAAGGSMFSMGAAPAANNSPGGRQIKPLRQRKR